MVLGFIKVRCPVCNGGGAVEPWFGQGCVLVPGQTIAAAESAKKCPACDGTGMQTVTINFDWGTSFPSSEPNHPPSPWYSGELNKDDVQKLMCEQCSAMREIREKIARDGYYIGDTPCQWCPYSPFKVTYRVTC